LKRRNVRRFLLLLGILFVSSALLLSIIKFRESQKQICVFPNGFEIENIPVGGLTPEFAKQRVKQIFESPITVKIDGSQLQINPKDLGTTTNIDQVIERAAKPCTQMTAWQKFWFSIWKLPVSGFETDPIVVNVENSNIQTFVDGNIINRYIELPLYPFALPGTTQFASGKPGTTIDRDLLVRKIAEALQNPENRFVEVSTSKVSEMEPDLSQIEYLLKDNIQKSNFEGIVEIYLNKLSTSESIQFAFQNRNPVTPDIAFTAASTVKIPIMVSSLWREEFPVSDLVLGWLNHMIIYSENDPADRLMERISGVRGPLVVTEDLQKMGLPNTFISGYFYFGAPLLDVVSTPANSRTDIDLDPDLYNQTTTSDIAALLSEIYKCASNNKNKLVEISENKITAEKCQLMVDTLSKNKIGALIEAGVPEGTRVAHKHGWSEETDGLLHTVSDVAIVFGPENDYVFTIFVYSSQQLLFDDANYLIAYLAQTAFNGLNPNHQIIWEFSEN